MLLHNFANEPESVKLFKDIKSFSGFKSALEKLSVSLPQTNPNNYNLSKNMVDNINKIKGDGFELFCELFVNNYGTHPHIGLAKYEPINKDDDEGVDAFAINIVEDKCAIQCKYVSDPNYEFSANDSNLPNFLIEARFNGIAWEEDTKVKRLFLMTSAKGIHYHTNKKWHNRVFVINGEMISQLVDNNKLFWNACADKLIAHQKE